MRLTELSKLPSNDVIYFPGQCGGSSAGRASAFQADCRGFEPRPPLHGSVAQGIEQQPSKLWVASSNLAGVTNNSKQEEGACPQRRSWYR